MSTPIVALLEKRGFLYNHSGDFPQGILIVPSHVPNNGKTFGIFPLITKIYNILYICEEYENIDISQKIYNKVMHN